jgi:hypothetical protein
VKLKKTGPQKFDKLFFFCYALFKSLAALTLGEGWSLQPFNLSPTLTEGKMSFLSAAVSALKYVPTTITAVRALLPLKRQIEEAELMYPRDPNDQYDEKVKSEKNEKKHDIVWKLVQSYLIEPFRDAGLSEKKVETLFSAFVILTKEFGKIIQGLKNVVKRMKG